MLLNDNTSEIIVNLEYHSLRLQEALTKKIKALELENRKLQEINEEISNRLNFAIAKLDELSPE